jgi:UDP-N-acetylglucosamine 3-dehydrogenase
MGTVYARVLSHLPEARLVGLCDQMGDRALELATTLGMQGYAGPDLTELLRSAPELHALVVATPESDHVHAALAALEADLDVYIEKPLAPSVVECRQILDAAGARNRLVMVGHTSRFDPRFAAAHEAVAGGVIGEPVYGFARRNNPASRLGRLGNRVSVLGFLGIHDIDLLLWFVGRPVRSVFARAVRRTLASLELDDCIVSVLTFDDGTLAVIENAWGVPDVQGQPTSITFTLQGTKGIVEINPREQGFGIFTSEGATYPDMWFKPELRGQIVGMYRDAMAHFVHCVRTREAPTASGQEGMEAVRVMEAVERSLAEGREVPLT